MVTRATCDPPSWMQWRCNGLWLVRRLRIFVSAVSKNRGWIYPLQSCHARQLYCVFSLVGHKVCRPELWLQPILFNQWWLFLSALVYLFLSLELKIITHRVSSKKKTLSTTLSPILTLHALSSWIMERSVSFGEKTALSISGIFCNTLAFFVSFSLLFISCFSSNRKIQSSLQNT